MNAIPKKSNDVSIPAKYRDGVWYDTALGQPVEFWIEDGSPRRGTDYTIVIECIESCRTERIPGDRWRAIECDILPIDEAP